MQFFAAQLPVVAEPVIEVPKILPTVLSYFSLQQLTAEQIVDIPAPGRAGGRGGRGGLQGFPGQDSTAFFGADRVDIPVPRSGGLQGSRPGQGSAASSSHVGAADDVVQRVFSDFSPEEKSAVIGPHSFSELSADFNPSTVSAHQTPLEQLVDVPVLQIPVRPSRRELHEVLSRLSSSLEEEEEVAEDEVEEEEEGSRFLPHFRPRRWCRFVLAGATCPRGWQCTFAPP